MPPPVSRSPRGMRFELAFLHPRLGNEREKAALPEAARGPEALPQQISWSVLLRPNAGFPCAVLHPMKDGPIFPAGLLTNQLLATSLS
jgi:hypothetical protein